MMPSENSQMNIRLTPAVHEALCKERLRTEKSWTQIVSTALAVYFGLPEADAELPRGNPNWKKGMKRPERHQKQGAALEPTAQDLDLAF